MISLNFRKAIGQSAKSRLLTAARCLGDARADQCQHSLLSPFLSAPFRHPFQSLSSDLLQNTLLAFAITLGFGPIHLHKLYGELLCD
jgi:hypothetical protein